MAGIVYRNICTDYGPDLPNSRWETPQKVVDKHSVNFLCDSQTQTDRKVLANQLDIVVVDKQKEAVVIDQVTATSRRRNMRS